MSTMLLQSLLQEASMYFGDGSYAEIDIEYLSSCDTGCTIKAMLMGKCVKGGAAFVGLSMDPETGILSISDEDAGLVGANTCEPCEESIYPISQISVGDPSSEGVFAVTITNSKSDGTFICSGPGRFTYTHNGITHEINYTMDGAGGAVIDSDTGTMSGAINSLLVDCSNGELTFTFDKLGRSKSPLFSGENADDIVINTFVTGDCPSESTNPDNEGIVCRKYHVAGDNNTASILSDDGTTTTFPPFTQNSSIGSIIGTLVQAPTCAVDSLPFNGNPAEPISTILYAAADTITLKEIVYSDGSITTVGNVVTNSASSFLLYPDIFAALPAGLDGDLLGTPTSYDPESGIGRFGVYGQRCGTALPKYLVFTHSCDPSVDVIMEMLPAPQLDY